MRSPATTYPNRSKAFTLRRRHAVLALALGFSAVLFTHASMANTAVFVLSGATDISGTDTASFSSAPGTGSDIIFTGTTTYNNNPAVFTLNGGSGLSVGTINDTYGAAVSATGTQTVTLNGGSNSFAPSASDLIYVSSTGNLTITAPIVITATSGNFDNAGTLTLNPGGTPTSLSGLIPNSGGTTALAFTGAGNTMISGVVSFDANYNSTSAPSSVTLSNSGTGLVTFGTINLTQSAGTNNANLTVNAVNGPMTFGGLRGSGDSTNLLFEGGNSIVVNTGTGAFNGTSYTGALMDGGDGSLFVTETGAATSVTINGKEGSLGTAADIAANTYTLTAGTLNLNAASSLYGTVTVNGGTLNLNVAGALASTSTTTILAITSGTLNNASGATISSVGEGGNQFGGSFMWAGSSPLTLTGTSTLGGAGPVTITTSGTSPLTLSGAIANGSSVVQLIKAGTGTLQLNGTNSTFTGGAVVQSGTLIAGASGALGSGLVTMGTSGGSSNATLLVNAGSESNSISTVAGDTGTMTIGNSTTSSATESGLITLNGNLQVAQASGGTLAFTGSFVGSSTASTPALLTLVPTGTANSISVNTISDGAGSGSQVSVLQTAGLLSINGPGSYSGGTTILSGTLTAAASGALGSGLVTMGASGGSSNVTLLVNAGSESNSITTVAGDTGTMTIGNATTSSATESGLVTLNTNLQVTQAAGGSLAFTGSFAGSSSAGTPTTATFNPASTGAITASSLADGASTLAVTKSGAGTLTLAGVNTYSGATTVSTGFLIYQGSGAMSPNSTVTETSGAAIQLEGGVRGTGSTTLTLSGTGETGATAALENLSGANSVSNPIVLASGPTSISSDTGSLTLTGGVTGAHTLDLFSTNTGSITFSGGVVNNLIIVNEGAGTGTVTINSAIGSSVTSGVTQSSTSSLLVLAGANIYSGATTISSAGTVQFDGTSAMSSNSTLSLANGSTVTLLADTPGTFTPASITLPSSGNTTLNFNVGPLTTAASNTLGLSGTLSFAGTSTAYSNVINVTGSNGYNLALGTLSLPSGVGGYTFTLNANNASVTTGTILAGSYGQAMSFGGNGSITINNLSFSSNGTSSFAVGNGSNTPTVTLLAAVTTFGSTRNSGGFTASVNSGATLNVNGAQALQDPNGATTVLTLNSGGDLNLNVASALSGATLMINGGTINNTSATANAGSGMNSLTDNGDFAWGGTDALTIGNSFALGGTASTLRTITTSGTAALTLSGNISTSGSITSLAVVGPGVLTLGGANTISGGVTLNGGQLNINNAGALGSGPFTITSGTLGNTSGGTITTTNAENWNASFTVSPASNLSSGTGAITLGASPTVNVTANTFTVNGAISGPGDSLTAAGTGALALGGSNSFNGGVTLSSGQLSINNNNALGAGAFAITSGTIDNTSGSSVTSTNSLQVNGNFAWKGSNALTLSGSGALSGATPTITTAGGSSLSLTGIVSGTSQLNVAGTGTLILNNSNTFSGGVAVSGGKLQVGTGSAENVAALGSGTATLNSGATLLFAPGSSSSTFDIANSFVLNGGTINSGDGVQHIGTGAGATIAITGAGSTVGSQYNGKNLYLDGQLTGSGPLTVENLDTGTAFGLSVVHITNNSNTYSGVLTVNGTANAGEELSVDVADALQDATLNLVGTGTSGATLIYTFTNSTNLLLGALEGNGNFALKDVGGSALAVSVGNNGGSTTYSGTMSSIGSLTKVGSGTFTLSGSNTYSGGTTVSAGALIVSGSISGTVSVSGTLGGGGAIGGAVTVQTGGTLAPGAAETTSAGATLTLGSGLTLSGTSTLAINLDSSNNIDSLAITGGLSIGADDTLTLNLLNGAALDQSSYTIATYTGALTGTFSVTNLPTNYTVDYGVGGDSIQLVAVAVPEPGALGTMLAGLGMLLGIQRWRKPRVGT
jgi:autotransporter-associated beta strand protein